MPIVEREQRNVVVQVVRKRFLALQYPPYVGHILAAIAASPYSSTTTSSYRPSSALLSRARVQPPRGRHRDRRVAGLIVPVQALELLA